MKKLTKLWSKLAKGSGSASSGSLGTSDSVSRLSTWLGIDVDDADEVLVYNI